MRLVTRGDLDGVTSAVLLTTMERIYSIELVHPQDIADKRFDVTDKDILANLPYHPKCAMWFDHHEHSKMDTLPDSFKGSYLIAPSASRVIYEHYSSDKLKKYEHLVDETDRFDSARLTIEDITDPKGLILLGFTIDSRSGIGRFNRYFIDLVNWLKTMPVEDVLSKPPVMERVKLLRENNAAFLDILRKYSRQDGNVVVTDLRPLDKAPIGNRFLIYTLFPQTNVSVRIQWGPEKKFAAVTLGHNIFNRTCSTDCGQICSDYGGGGHFGAAACPLKPETAEQQIAEVIQRLKKTTNNF
jgi:hypothetical protein